MGPDLLLSMSERGVTLCEPVEIAELIRFVSDCVSECACFNGWLECIRPIIFGWRSTNSIRQIRICEMIMSDYVVTLVEWDNARVNRADQIVLV